MSNRRDPTYLIYRGEIYMRNAGMIAEPLFLLSSLVEGLVTALRKLDSKTEVQRGGFRSALRWESSWPDAWDGEAMRRTWVTLGEHLRGDSVTISEPEKDGKNELHDTTSLS